jgi:BirA family biotin operon repressor/biotin-[acetyl-CoA-carboxylase] ligase
MKKYDLPFKALHILSDGNFHSGEKMAADMGCSRVTVWKSISELKSLGINIFSVKKRVTVYQKKYLFLILRIYKESSESLTSSSI